MSEFSFKRMATMSDPLADAVALRLDRRRPSVMMDETHYLAKTEIGPYQEFVDNLYDVPSWVDWQLIDQGQKLQAAFHHARLLAMLTGSLLEILCSSQVSSHLVARNHCHLEVVRRLHETSQIMQNVCEKDSLKPGGKGHRTLAEIRLGNAMLRKSLLGKEWKIRYNTTPVSQLDMIVDILNLGYGTTRNSEKLGIQLNDYDKAALQHFWRYGAYIYGVEENLLSTSVNEEQERFMQFKTRRTNLGPEQRRLVKTTLALITEQTSINFSPGLLQAFSRVCLGDAKATALNIPKQPSWRRAVSLYTTANRGAAFAYHHIPGMTGVNQKLNEYLAQSFLPSSNNNKRRPVREIA